MEENIQEKTMNVLKTLQSQTSNKTQELYSSKNANLWHIFSQNEL